MNLDENLYTNPIALIKLALAEDLGDGDHTSLSCIPHESMGKAKLLIKEKGVLAGMDIAEQVFKEIDPDIQFRKFIDDGSQVEPGQIAFEIEGRIHTILSGERLALNFMQRMSGIATFTAQIVAKINGLDTKILDTRKTTPNMRYFEKEAVRIGGGQNHRMGLYDMIMIKDNHVDFAGGIGRAIQATNQYLKEKQKELKIEIEVRGFDELHEVLDQGNIDRIMLDNFSPENLKKAVRIINKKYETEASGGIGFNDVRDYAESGVDFISIGALTHQIKSLDMSLKANLKMK
jgi:nicotinate-nucleotide pyrophosphorylase (carboxylating)